MTDSEVIKVQLRLNDEVPGGQLYGTETPWAEVIETLDDGSKVVRMANTSFFVALGLGDVVRVQENADGIYQVVELIERGDYASYAVYLTTDEELEAGNDLGELQQRARAQYLDYNLEQAGHEYIIGGAIGIAPVVFVSFKAETQEEIDSFEEDLIRICEENSCTPELITAPDDTIAGQTVPGLDLDLLTETTIIEVETDYDARLDPHWNEWEMTPATPAHKASFLSWVNEVTRRDERVARDLEAGRYDRVELLLSRLMTDSQDLPPLDGPIWKDEE